MSSKKVKLKSVERNTRKNTRSSRNNPVKPAKKQNQAVNKTDDIDFDEFNRKRIEEARKANVIVLSEIKKSLEEKKEPEPKKTFKDPLWYIGTGVLWLFDTLRGRTEKQEDNIPATEPVAEPEPVVEPEPVAEPEPVVELEPVVEPEPVAEPEPVIEPEPVVEPEPVAEPEPVVEPEPIAEPEPVAEPELAAESEIEQEESDDDTENDDSDEEDDGDGFVVIQGNEENKKRGFSVAYLSRYAKTAAKGADTRIKENIKLQKKKESLEKKLEKFSIPKRATEDTVLRLNSEKESMIKELAEIENAMEYNLSVAESLERAADEYAYIRNKVDGTVIEGLRKTERLHPEKVEVDKNYLDSLIEQYNMAKMANESK